MTKLMDEFLKKEITRKQFIALLGLTLMSLFGYGRLAKLLNSHGFMADKSVKPQNR